MPDLFDPLAIGAIQAPNRILMAPLTRGRADRAGVPGPLAVEYYRQRAGAGLIISEATGISREGLGWPYAPGLWTDAQVEGWKPVTDAVHATGGRIVAQLWHMGYVVHSSVTGTQPVSASVATAPGKVHTYDGKQPYEAARALTLDDIARILDDYTASAARAKAAGFDGVQLHAANGYLIDEFLRDGINARDDAYGGSPENRIRLLAEATDRLIDVWGADRVGVRLSPTAPTQGVEDSDPASVFLPAARALADRRTAFLELREPGADGTFGTGKGAALSPRIRQAFPGVLILNSDYSTRDQAQATLDAGAADAISFGRAYLANPDLPERLRTGAPLNPDDMATWYSQGPKGYVDYPTLADAQATDAGEPGSDRGPDREAWTGRTAQPAA